MGTFGVGPFANDAALDWVAGFSNRKSLRALEKALASLAQNQLEAEELIACAEVICAISGHPHPDLDPTIQDWAEKQQGKLAEETRLSALEAVRMLRGESSEIHALWAETPHLGDWLSQMDDLCARLEQRSLTKGEPRARKPARIEVSGSESSEPKAFSLSGALPDLQLPQPGIGAASSVWLRLSQDIDEAELAAFVDWIASYPELRVGLSDYPRKKGFKLDPSLLERFSGIRRLILALEKLTTFEPLAAFADLTELDVRFCGAARPFAPLTALNTLRALSFYEPKPEALVDGTPDIAKLQALESLELIGMRDLGRKGTIPIETRFKVADLPVLPPRLKKLHITCAGLGDISGLETSRELRSIDIAEAKTTTAKLDLSRLEQLSRFELVRVEGISRIILPLNLRSLQLEDTFGATAELPADNGRLRALRIDRGALSPAALRRLDLNALIFATLHDAESLEAIAHASQLALLYLDCRTLHAARLAPFSGLRCLTLTEVSGDISELLQQVALLPALEELMIIFSLDETTELKLADFDCLRGHPRLKQLGAIGVFTERGAEQQLYDYLGLERLRVGNSVETRLLGELESELTAETTL